MNTLKSIIFATLISMSFIMGAAWAQTPVKIGFVAELSGPTGGLGQDQYDGFMLFVERNGGKLGGVPVQVIKEDSAGKIEVATQVVQKLIEKENVPIITGITLSNIMMAIHKPITEKQVFLISSLAGPSPIAGAQCSPYQFITSWQNDQLSEVMGKYASDKGYKRLYVMAANVQGGRDFVAGFKRYYKGQIVDEVYTPLTQQDFSAEMAQLQSARPDAVFAFYAGALAINFMRQYQQAGLLKNVPLLTAGIADGSTMPALKETALGIVGGAPWTPDLDNPANRRFVEEFEKKYNRIPASMAAYSYDAAQLLDSALAKVKGNVGDKKAFMAALKAADFPSVRGKFKFASNHFPVHDLHLQEVARDVKGRVSLKKVSTPLPDLSDVYYPQCAMK